MEIRARYLTIGLFTLGAIAAGFLFVYWLYNGSGLARRDLYRVHFKGTVSGLFRGSPVAFNGLRVGEVLRVGLNGDDPGGVDVTIGVAPGTPVRADTKISLDFQGLTGSANVALTGGDARAAALSFVGGEPPLLIADAEASRSVTDSARDVMQKLDVALAENSEPMKMTLNNLKTFTDALARNSDRVDAILTGLQRMTGGAGKKPTGFVVDLSPPQYLKPAAAIPAGQLAIAEPSAVGTVDTDKVILDPSAGAEAAPGQWSDVLTKLVQTRMVQSFENAGMIGSVLRGGDGVTADYQMQTDLRSLRVDGAPVSAASYEISAKLLNDKGRILAGRIFKAKVAMTANDAKSASGALNQAFGEVTGQIVDWTLDTLRAQPPKAADSAPMPAPAAVTAPPPEPPTP